HYMTGGHLYLLGEKERGEKLIQRAFELDPGNVGTYYNVACMYSNANEIDKSIAHLKKALELGFNHREWVEKDPDLNNIRSDPRFKKILSSMK
ncbi:MAG TPA: hypothetical protein VLA34_10580, partial [Candidatus Krumholzibacterium sp.]|nr:hypothetical protein [Candidatus Krumholzibacterium sp.]